MIFPHKDWSQSGFQQQFRGAFGRVSKSLSSRRPWSFGFGRRGTTVLVLCYLDAPRLVKYDSIWAMCVSFAAGSRLPKILPPALQHTPLVLCPGGKVRDLPGEEIPRLPDRGNVARNNSVIPWRCR
eukprot:symbB.v1.2.002517.t1/scaffold134.1/size305535/1